MEISGALKPYHNLRLLQRLNKQKLNLFNTNKILKQNPLISRNFPKFNTKFSKQRILMRTTVLSAQLVRYLQYRILTTRDYRYRDISTPLAGVKLSCPKS